jgi:hypothetical protein
MTLSEPIRITLAITRIFNRLQIPYVVGGSLASSFHGIPRATQDVDIVADIKHAQINPLVKALEKSWYIDRNTIRDAIDNQSSFNILYLETMYKIDVFILKDDPASLSEMKRRQKYAVEDDRKKTLYIASAEDIILQKLYWYTKGGNVSERQWNDAIGVIKVQNKNLDLNYLKNTAQKLGISELLSKLLKECEIH